MRSLLLLFLALAALLAFLGEEAALGLEPVPAALNVARSVVHGHLLADLLYLLILLDGLLLFALLAFCCVCLDLLHDLGDLLRRLHLLLFDLIALSLDTSPLGLARLLLLLRLALQQLDALRKMSPYDAIDLLFSGEHFPETIDLLLQLSLLLLVLTVFARLLALNLSLQVLNVQVLLNLGFILLALQLGHLLRVILLLVGEVVLQLLVLLRRRVDVHGEFALLLL